MRPNTLGEITEVTNRICNRYKITERRSGLTSDEQRITWNLFWTAIIAGTILFILFH